MLENVLVEFLNRVDEAILVIDATETILFFNQGAEKLFQKKSAEIIGKEFKVLIPTFVRDRFTEDFANPGSFYFATVRTGESFDLTIERQDGSILPARGILQKINSGGQSYTVVALRNLRELMPTHEVMIYQGKRVDTFLHLESEITHGDDLNKLLDVVIDEMITQLSMDAVAVLRFDGKRQELVYSTGRGFTTNALRHTRLKIGEGNAGKAARDKQILFLKGSGLNKTEFLRSPEFISEGFASYHAVPLYFEDRLLGVIELFSRSEFSPDADWYNFLQALADQTAIALENFQLFFGLKQDNLELARAYDETIEGWVHCMDIRGHEVEGHTRRVTETALSLAALVGVPENEMVHYRRGSLLHDIGNTGVPDRILLKPDALTEEEMLIVRQHPVFAREMLYPITYLRPAMDIPCYHHEYWDGSGYPNGMKGEEIPLAARIFAIADVWDALRSNRLHRPAWPKDQAAKYLHSMTGVQFDPNLMPNFWKIIEK